MSSESTSADMPRMRALYQNQIVQTLMKEFGYKNVMQVPSIKKISINIGLGEALQNNKAVEAAVGDLTIIAGQKPVVTKARKSIAIFKLREGMPIGAMVTLRGTRMWDFLDRLMVVGITASVCANSWSFQKSNMIKSIRFEAWKSLL